MSLFKIKITPKMQKTVEWDYKYQASSRVHKICHICNKNILMDKPNTAFQRKVKIGTHTSYNSLYTCGTSLSQCTIKMKIRLGLK